MYKEVPMYRAVRVTGPWVGLGGGPPSRSLAMQGFGGPVIGLHWVVALR